LYNLSAKLN